MSRVDPRLPPPRPHTVVAWSILLASALLLAALLHAIAGRALAGPGASAPTPVARSPATAALTDGDDVRAHMLAGRPAPASTTTSAR